jgi:4-diphosphocytidyl-2-C-methyl-D-erythritol kinase
MAAEAALRASGAPASCTNASGERLAPAKVNLYLHLRGRRPDAYHLLDSLVVFPAVGDLLAAEPADTLSLSVSGPFADGLSAGGDNLVLRAAAALARHHGIAAGAALRLSKTLPIASGIGGGSSDAAAALRLLARLWGVAVPDGLALSLGADVPVCCAAPRPMRMQGIGELLSPASRLPPFWLVLVNPRRAVSTGAVFAGVRDRAPPPAPPAPEGGFARFGALADWLARQRNDLQASAVVLCPAIGEVLAALSDAPVARMSGSGATCFAMVETEGEALALADRLRPRGWWVAAAPVAPAPDRSDRPLDDEAGNILQRRT